MNLVAYHQQYVAPYVRARWGGDDERGASLVEYALLVALIAVVCILAITFLGKSTSDKLSHLGSNIGG
ncbi:MAG: pilus assembly protein Flp/PilA [Actinomycetota bacterium]|nr:pilus assembly protein Flp/PilA [Actinomycetota bacterium]